MKRAVLPPTTSVPVRPQAVNFPGHVGIASHIDDEIGRIGFQKFSVVGGNRQAEFAGEDDAGRAFIFVRDSDNLDARDPYGIVPPALFPHGRPR